MAGFVEHLIRSENIQVKISASDWEDAVRKCGAMMIDSGFCTQEYVDAAVTNHREIGPYYIIAPGIAMPHAKPEKGVLETGYALVTLSTPVVFGDEDNDPVDLLIFAGAKSREEHNTEVIPEIAELCDSDSHVQAIRDADDAEMMRLALEKFLDDYREGRL